MSQREVSSRENTISDRCPWTYTVLKKSDREIAFFDVLSPIRFCIRYQIQLYYML